MERIKLHLFLARAGVASRRKSSELVFSGKVKVNGQVVTNVALRIDPERDAVTVGGRSVSSPETPEYILLNKPKGYVSAASDPEGRKTVLSLVRSTSRLYPVGRLDIDSQGLILLTNDGYLAYALTHPKFEVKKTYRVLIKGAPGNAQLNKLRNGVKLRDGWTHPADVSVAGHDSGNTWLDIIIHEGRNRQVRRMCAHVGLEVLELIRTSMGPLELGLLETGKHRALTAEELAGLLQSVRSVQ